MAKLLCVKGEFLLLNCVHLKNDGYNENVRTTLTVGITVKMTKMFPLAIY